jgi:type VI secretion system protein ImpA
MATPQVLDFEKLLAPIPGDNPAGVDLRETDSAKFYQIRDARTSASRAEADSIADPSSDRRADWRTLVTVSTGALCETTKSLEITAFLIEGLTRQYGFAGLRDGFRLARELASAFWDVIYPLPDEYGMETRVFTLGCLNGHDGDGTVTPAIDRIAITVTGSSDPFALWQYRQALEIDRLDPDVKQNKIAQGALSLEVFRAAVTETPAQFFADLLEDIQQAADEFQQLTEVLDDKCGHASPPSSDIRSALQRAKEEVEFFARDRLATLIPEETGEPVPEGEEGAKTSGEGGGQGGSTGPLRNREDAFRLLMQVADYFRKAEPHNPVSYSLQQVVRWGRMPLPDLLKELVSDDSMRMNLFKQIGIQSGDDSSGS